MKIPAMRALLVCAAMTSCWAPVLADAPPKQATISVGATGSVTYVPDLARLSLGVRAQAAAAAPAAASVNSRAQAVVAALRGMGIPDRSMKTTGYTIEYVQPQESNTIVPQIMSASPSANAKARSSPVMRTLPPGPRRPLPTGYYVATESIQVTTSVARAGAVLDAAVKAGANEAYDLTLDTTQRDALYATALTRAVTKAREQADVAARAAGVTIEGIDSISIGGTAPEPIQGVAFAARTAPPIQAGTDQITASVQVVYRIR